MAIFNRDFGTANGKGVKKGEKKSRLAVFWRILKEKFGKLCLLNLIYCACVIPFVVFLALLFFNMMTYATSETPQTDQAPQTQAVSQTAEPSTDPTEETETPQWGDLAVPVVGSYLSLGPASVWFLLFLFIGNMDGWILLAVLLFTLLTFGPATTALTKIIRNFVSQKPCFVWSDFWRAFKQSYFKNVLIGALDLLISCVMAYAVYNYYYVLRATPGFINQILFFISVAVLILYSCARQYLYLMQATFRLRAWQILKNSFIMALYGLFKNLGAFLINVAFYLLFFLGYTAWFAPVMILMPLAVLFAFPVFFSVYIVYPDFYRVLVKPEEDKMQPEEVNPIFIDRG